MKSGGDLSDSQRQQSVDLTEFEQLVDGDTEYSNEHKAQLYTCVAHDWYQIGMEEEGNRLILKAERVCPGYFKGPMIQHRLESPGFDIVVKSLTFELINLLTDTLKSK